MKKILTLTMVGSVVAATNVMASGFNLREQSVSALGNAFAGATAGADDISYSYFNPAGLTRHKGTQVNAGAIWVAPRSKAKRAHAETPWGSNEASGYTGDIVHAAIVPNAYMSYQINEKFTSAVSINVPYGMITKYNDAWAGRFHGTLSKVETLTVTPMLAYKATDKLSLGAGVQMQYIKARLRNAVGRAPLPIEDAATLKGDAFDTGYTLGALYEFNPSTRVGVGYRSEIAQKLHGDVKFNGIMASMNQDISARITTPANLTVGGYHDINNQWAVMAEVGRTYWSSFKNLIIEGENGLRSTTEERWKDTTFYAIGASYKYDDNWLFRAGFAVDQSAVGKTYRTPRIPDSDRLWYSAGVEYKHDDNWTFNVGYTYIRADNGFVALDGSHAGDKDRGSLYADYENDVHILGMGLNYAF